jgi:hypothetical protein
MCGGRSQWTLPAACATALALAAALVFFTPPASASEATPDARPERSSHFNVCRDQEIACFRAELTFQGHDSFVLSDVRLRDTGCDTRSIFAFVYDENGFLGQFQNAHGCNTTARPSDQTMSDPLGTTWVQMRLYACDTTSCISIPYSLKHYDPY